MTPSTSRVSRMDGMASLFNLEFYSIAMLSSLNEPGCCMEEICLISPTDAAVVG